MLGVLGEHGREIAMKRHVVAYQHSVTDREGEAHGLVVGVSDADRESASVEGGFEVEDSEHLHAVACNRVFLPHHRDLSEAQRFDQRPDNLEVRKGLMSYAPRGRRDHLQFFSGDLRTPAMSQKLRLLHVLVSPFNLMDRLESPRPR